MSLKDDWKNTGKGIGKSFAGLGKAIFKSAKVGLQKLDEKASDEPPKEKKDTGLMESWSKVGHSFGETGKSLGKASAGTAKKAIGKSDDPKEEPKDEKKEKNG